MVTHDDARAADVVAFGPFRLTKTERLLLRSDKPVAIRGRALDILIVLVERAGEIVSNNELMSRAWPGVSVEEGNLRVQIATLRKALGEGQAGARYVTNIPGRGYSFVAPIVPVAESLIRRPPPCEPLASDQDHGVPAVLTRLVGRDEFARRLSEKLTERRFVTIVGPGGIGKTSVAVSIGQAQLAAFEGAVRFVDLGPLNDPRLVASTLASKLGLSVPSNDPTASSINFLRSRRMLLILDSCEHVVEAAAALAERIFTEAPRAHILATSREALRVEGEHVMQLPPLEVPPDDPSLTSAEALAFPAAQLLMERAAASGRAIDLSDADAPAVGSICRKLDGIALAIELAAGQVPAFGLHGTAALVSEQVSLHWRTRRTAHRHQTLSAMLDWSYSLLSESERVTLRALSVLVGPFTIEAARAIVAGSGLDPTEAMEALATLVEKSLITINIGCVRPRYRLLDTTRRYAFQKLVESGERDTIAASHANYCRTFLERAHANYSEFCQGEGRQLYQGHIDNVREALRWCFSEHGDIEIGVALTAVSARLFLQMSLLSECRHCVERALAARDETERAPEQSMELWAALGMSLLLDRTGDEDRVNAAFEKALEFSKELDDRYKQLRVLGGLHLNRITRGNVQGALTFARSGEAVAKEIHDPAASAMADGMMAACHHILGELDRSQAYCKRILTPVPLSARAHDLHVGFDIRSPALCAYARNLWLQGYPEQALMSARQILRDAEVADIPLPRSFCLSWTASIFIWTGELHAAEMMIDALAKYSAEHSLLPYEMFAYGLKGTLLISRGETDAGVRLLHKRLGDPNKLRYEIHDLEFCCALVEAMASIGQSEQALEIIDEVSRQMAANGGSFNMPEMLRIKGNIVASVGGLEEAQQLLQGSIDMARQQSALSWELRTATCLALLWSRQGRLDQAHGMLASVYDRFTEGFGTSDLQTAARALGHLSRSDLNGVA